VNTKTKIRYYLVADDDVLRITEKLHRELVARKKAVFKFAGTDQKIIEAVSGPQGTRARGLIYHFDNDGLLNVADAAEASALALKSDPVSQAGVIDASGLFVDRKWSRKRRWTIPSTTLRKAEADLLGLGKAKNFGVLFRCGVIRRADPNPSQPAPPSGP
jgi:hypothetical protein